MTEGPTLVSDPEERNIAGDGNCLYASVVDQFEQLEAMGRPIPMRLYVSSRRCDKRERRRVRRISVRLLRLLTVDWLRRNRDTPVVEGLTVGDLYEADKPEVDWEKYLESQRMHEPTPLPIEAWGNIYSIIAIANLFRVCVVVYQQAPEGTFLSHTYVPKPPHDKGTAAIHLLYDWEARHYSSVRLSP